MLVLRIIEILCIVVKTPSKINNCISQKSNVCVVADEVMLLAETLQCMLVFK